jgi:hypothetical protein
VWRAYDPGMKRRSVNTTDAEAVRAEHEEAFKRLMFVLKRHRSELSEEGWRLFNRVAFSLYLDSRTIDAITPIHAILSAPEAVSRARRV